MTTRRSFLTGFGASLIAAPAVVRAASLMPVRGIIMPVVRAHVDVAASFDGMKRLAWNVAGKDYFGNDIQEIIPFDPYVRTTNKFSVVESMVARWVVTDDDPLPRPSFSRDVSPDRDPRLIDWKVG